MTDDRLEMGAVELEEMGPVDYLVIEFPAGYPTGENLPLLLDLYERFGPVVTVNAVDSVDEGIEHLGELASAGVERVMLQHLLHRDLDAVAQIGRRVVPVV